MKKKLHLKNPTSRFNDNSFADQLSTLGKYTVLFRNVYLMNSSLGDYSYVQSNSSIYNTDVGNFCSIGSSVSIGLGDHPTHMVSTSPVFYDKAQPLPKFYLGDGTFFNNDKRTSIGADVWVGHGVLIKAGLSIGVGCIVGAGSVVTKDLPPYSISVGNPCKIIKFRFDEKKIKELLETKWWDMNEKFLKEHAENFQDVNIFINAFNAIKKNL
jgi:acetyltransferase-like isoleucine patch superfamily enzyme